MSTGKERGEFIYQCTQAVREVIEQHPEIEFDKWEVRFLWATSPKRKYTRITSFFGSRIDKERKGLDKD